MTSLVPRLDILPEPQCRLWPELTAIPDHFTLYGGTALAFRLAHRVSADFDFVSNQPFDAADLAAAIPPLRDAEQVQVAPNTLTCRVERGGPVLVSFIGDLRFGQVRERDQASDIGLGIVSLLDIAGTKAAVIQRRAEAKDYADIAALLDSGIDLPTILAAASIVYGRTYNPLITLKALSYFDDVPALPPDIRERLAQAVARANPDRLPRLTAYRERETP
jgi:Nucleotidyl transferase AbiEii toxin, Type IV TA system